MKPPKKILKDKWNPKKMYQGIGPCTKLHGELEIAVRKHEMIKPKGPFAGAQLSHRDRLLQAIKRAVSELRTLSSEENYFWQFCDFEVFQSTIEIQKKMFFDVSEDAEEHGFWNFTLNEIKVNITNKTIKLREEPRVEFPIHHYLSDELSQSILFSEKKKRKFVLSQLENAESSSKTSNPFPGVFTVPYSYHLFICLVDQLGKKPADLSYIYRQMKVNHRDESNIVGTQEEFKKFCLDHLGVSFSKIIQLDEMKGGKRGVSYQATVGKFKNTWEELS